MTVSGGTASTSTTLAERRLALAHRGFHADEFNGALLGFDVGSGVPFVVTATPGGGHDDGAVGQPVDRPGLHRGHLARGRDQELERRGAGRGEPGP